MYIKNNNYVTIFIFYNKFMPVKSLLSFQIIVK